MAGSAVRGKSADPEKVKELKKQLSGLMRKLKTDDKSPELWLKAGKIYLALGEYEKAIKCGKACLRIDANSRAAKLLVGKAKKAIEQARKEDQGSGEAFPSQDVTVREVSEEPEEPILYRGPLIWLPEEERPRFKSEEEALEQLRRELSPATTVTCPECNTLLELEEEYCYGCGRPMGEKVETLEQRVGLALERLEEDPEDRDALFTLGAYLAVNGQLEESLEALNRLTMLDGSYPGLWWLKARLFEQLGKREAAQAAIRRAMQLEAEGSG